MFREHYDRKVQYTLKVNHLPHDVTENGIRELRKFGDFSSVKVISGTSESYALINYDSENEAEWAMRKNNGKAIFGHVVSIVCKWKSAAQGAAASAPIVEQHTLKVTNLASNVTQEEMEGICRRYSDYHSLKVNAGYAFVNFFSYKGAMRAMEHLKTFQFSGQCPTVRMHSKNVQKSQIPQSHSPQFPSSSSYFSETQQGEMSTIKVNINGRGITGQDLERYFSPFGKILNRLVIKPGNPDYAFVNFGSVNEAVAACKNDKILLNDVPISMKLLDKPLLPALIEKGSKLVLFEDDSLVNLILTTCAFKDIESKLSNVSAQPSKDGRGVHISGDKDKVEMAENIIHLHMKLLQAQIVSESMNLHCQFIPLLKDPQVFQSIEQEHGVEFSIKLADSSTKSIAALSSTVASVSSDTYPLTIESISEYLSSTSTGLVTWNFYDDNGQFTPMSKIDSGAVENLYQQWLQQQIILCCYSRKDHRYQYDFKSMAQTNLSTGKKRLIRRASSPGSLSLCLSCRGLQESVQTSFACLSKKLGDMVVMKSFRDVSADIAEPLTKLAQSFCVCVTSSSTDDKIVLSGSSQYLAKVFLILTEKQNSLQANPLLSSSFPPEWEPQDDDVELKSVKRDSSEWLDIENSVRKTIPDVAILEVQRIQNKFLYVKYDLCKKRMHVKNKGMVNEKRLFHGSRNVSPHKIYESEHGFDFRYGGQGMWGKGAYFAVNASYSANSYEFHTSHGQQIFMAFVLTGDSKTMPSKPSLVTPPSKEDGSGGLYDSVNGTTGSSQVYIVYDHDKCYPAYLITYR